MRVIYFFVIAIVAFGCSTRKSNEKFIKPGELWLDNNDVHINAHGGGILFYGDKYFWYGEHKIEGDAGNKAHVGVHVYSSSDLINWFDEGIALKVIEDDTDHEITKGCVLERPKVIYNQSTGKFVMWFHLELKDRKNVNGPTGESDIATPERAAS